ncbi:5416_t:CDS:2 [Entrophospora sp. SA101]|nr:5416_t:CDS:2 [Entrophospora sp. SA101]
MFASIEPMRPYFPSIIGVSLEEYDEMIRKFILEIIKHKTYLKSSRIYGKKKVN